MMQVCNAAQNFGWADDVNFYLCVVDNALCGAVRESEGLNAIASLTERTASFDPGHLGPLSHVVSRPLSLLRTSLHQKREKAHERAMVELASGDYMRRNKMNFRIAVQDVQLALFFDPTVAFSSDTSFQMRLYLEDGQRWHFTFEKETDATQLQSDMQESGIPTRHTNEQLELEDEDI